MTAPVEEWTGTLAVGEIRESPFNPRRTYDQAKLQELADSMFVHGQLSPLVVRPLGPDPRLGKKGQWEGVEAWELVCGHRRLRAAKLAAVPRLKVVARLLDDNAARCIQLIENAQREDVSPSEQAAAVGELAAAVGQEEAARQVGWPLARVRDLLRLAALPGWFLAAVDAGEVPLSTAAIVGRIPSESNRTTAAACVLLGVWSPTELTPEDLADCEEGKAAKIRGDIGEGVLTVKDAKELVKRFQRELKGAPFRKALDLIDGVPPCGDCPKMAGNAAKLDPDYADVRADTCLDPTCFADKQDAWGKLTVAKAEKKGRTVLPQEVAAKLFNEYGDSGLRSDAGYVELDDVCYDDPRKGEPRTYGELLKGHVEPVLAIDPNGRARDLVDRKTAAEVLKREHKIGIRGGTPAKGSTDDKAERAKRAAEAKLRRAVVRGVLDRAATAAAELYAERAAGVTNLLAAIARETVRTCWGSSLEDVCHRRGLKGSAGDRRAALDTWVGSAPPEDLFGLVVEFLAARQVFGYGSEKEAKVLTATLGIDKKAIEREAKEQFKAEAGKGGAKKAKATPAKPAAKSAPATDWESVHVEDLELSEETETALEMAGITTAGVLWRLRLKLLEHGLDAGEAAECLKAVKAIAGDKPEVKDGPGVCRVCGCTEANCTLCIERTGEPCSWAEPDLCSACVGADVHTPAAKPAPRANGVAVGGDPSAWADLIPPAEPAPSPRPSLAAAVAHLKGEPIDALDVTASELSGAHAGKQLAGLKGMDPPAKRPRIPHVRINGRPHVVLNAWEGFPDSGSRSWDLRPLWPRHLAEERGIAPTHADPLEGLAVEINVGFGKAASWNEHVIGSKGEARKLIHTPTPAKPAKKKQKGKGVAA